MADAEASKSKKVFYRDSKGELHALKPGQENPDQKREREKTDEDRHSTVRRVYGFILPVRCGGQVVWTLVQGPKARRSAKGFAHTRTPSVYVHDPLQSRHESRRDEAFARYKKCTLLAYFIHIYKRPVLLAPR